MTTQTRVLSELDEALDFEPTCEWTAPTCLRVASWFGEPPCKCEPKLACTEHKASSDAERRPYRCRFCPASFWAADVTWRPL